MNTTPPAAPSESVLGRHLKFMQPQPDNNGDNDGNRHTPPHQPHKKLSFLQKSLLFIDWALAKKRVRSVLAFGMGALSVIPMLILLRPFNPQFYIAVMFICIIGLIFYGFQKDKYSYLLYGFLFCLGAMAAMYFALIKTQQPNAFFFANMQTDMVISADGKQVVHTPTRNAPSNRLFFTYGGERIVKNVFIKKRGNLKVADEAVYKVMAAQYGFEHFGLWNKDYILAAPKFNDYEKVTHIIFEGAYLEVAKHVKKPTSRTDPEAAIDYSKKIKQNACMQAIELLETMKCPFQILFVRTRVLDRYNKEILYREFPYSD